MTDFITRWSAECRFVGRVSLIFLLALGVPEYLFAQQTQQPAPISLEQAVRVALEKNPERKAALAETQAASANVIEARANLMPRVTLSESVTRGNDPVYVFGSKLRQQRFGPSDLMFSSLNTPRPYGNFSTRFGATWNLFDSFASWHAVTRAKRMQDAAGEQLARSDQEIIFRVVDSFYAVLLAKKRLEVDEQSLQTAQSILGQSKNRYESGLAVESDLLSARVRFAARQEELIRAQNDLSLARAQLSTSMGLPAENDYDPAGALAEKNLPALSLEETEKLALQMRPDLKQIRSEESAQNQSLQIAKSSFGPRVSAFGGWEADNPTFLAGGGGNNWLAGIDLQLDLFQGGAKRAELSRERALQNKLAAAKDMASDAIRLEVRRAYYQMDAARRQIEVARATIAQAQESLRINQNRYDSGLSTISDLLSAEEAARATEADYWDAVYRYETSYANLELASGTLNPESPVVTP